MTARPAKEHKPVTIHYETVEALVRGAEYQDVNAANAREAAEEMAKEAAALTDRLAELAPRQAAAEQAVLDAERLAADFRAVAADYCQRNGWDMPEPKADGPETHEDTRPGVDAVKAALAEEGDTDE